MSLLNTLFSLGSKKVAPADAGKSQTPAGRAGDGLLTAAVWREALALCRADSTGAASLDVTQTPSEAALWAALLSGRIEDRSAWTLAEVMAAHRRLAAKLGTTKDKAKDKQHQEDHDPNHDQNARLGEWHRLLGAIHARFLRPHEGGAATALYPVFEPLAAPAPSDTTLDRLLARLATTPSSVGAAFAFCERVLVAMGAHDQVQAFQARRDSYLRALLADKDVCSEHLVTNVRCVLKWAAGALASVLLLRRGADTNVLRWPSLLPHLVGCRACARDRGTSAAADARLLLGVAGSPYDHAMMARLTAAALAGVDPGPLLRQPLADDELGAIRLLLVDWRRTLSAGAGPSPAALDQLATHPVLSPFNFRKIGDIIGTVTQMRALSSSLGSSSSSSLGLSSSSSLGLSFGSSLALPAPSRLPRVQQFSFDDDASPVAKRARLGDQKRLAPSSGAVSADPLPRSGMDTDTLAVAGVAAPGSNSSSSSSSPPLVAAAPARKRKRAPPSDEPSDDDVEMQQADGKDEKTASGPPAPVRGGRGRAPDAPVHKFDALLRKEMKARKWTQAELAQAIGGVVRARHLSALLCGKHISNRNKVEKEIGAWLANPTNPSPGADQDQEEDEEADDDAEMETAVADEAEEESNEAAAMEIDEGDERKDNEGDAKDVDEQQSEGNEADDDEDEKTGGKRGKGGRRRKLSKEELAERRRLRAIRAAGRGLRGRCKTGLGKAGARVPARGVKVGHRLNTEQKALVAEFADWMRTEHQMATQTVSAYCTQTRKALISGLTAEEIRDDTAVAVADCVVSYADNPRAHSSITTAIRRFQEFLEARDDADAHTDPSSASVPMATGA